MRLTTIVGLLLCRGPAAVSWFIIAMIIDAINGISRSRSLAHIFIKIHEIIPSFANGDSSSTPSWPILGVRLQAPLTHMKPRPIFRPFLCMYRCPMFPIRSAVMQMLDCLFRLVYSEASATFRVTSAQRLGFYNSRVSANALTFPSGVSIVRVCACA